MCKDIDNLVWLIQGGLTLLCAFAALLRSHYNARKLDTATAALKKEIRNGHGND